MRGINSRPLLLPAYLHAGPDIAEKNDGDRSSTRVRHKN